jgi:putative transposase
MTDILALIQCFAPCISPTTMRQMRVIMPAMITMTGRVTMRGISRWTEKGGSYRTVQRFFQTGIPWSLLFWWFFREHLHDPGEVYLLAGDECVVSKSGKETHGLDRFFASLYGKPIPGVSFFTLALVSTQERRSYPVMVEQVIRTEAEKSASKARKQAKQAKSQTVKGKPGRPKGSKNKAKTPGALTAELERVKAMVLQQLALINGAIPLAHLVLDGHFGNPHALQMAHQCDLHLISKLRHDAALYLPYEGVQKQRGAPRQYGDKVNYDQLPAQCLKESVLEDGLHTATYQAMLLHKAFAQPLNVVIIVKTNPKTRKRAHVVLFSSDLALTYDQLIDYYSLRFQIEFNFRDAKQYWGLEDFMNVSPIAVTNAANLSLFMVNLTQPLLREFQQDSPGAGILDLKATFRGHKYVTETLKLLPEMPEPILINHIFATIARIGRIYADEPHLKAA